MTMDVDLLRPGTVPISPDTVLWFEFLLNPSLLQIHISKPLPDPSPTDLIIKFMTINAEQNNEVKVIENDANEIKINVVNKWTYKNLALKILSLKVAAYLKWDLESLQKKIPLQMQLTLLQDLFFITMDAVVEIPAVPETKAKEASDRALFTLVLYHRWLLRAIVFRALNNKQQKSFSHNPVIQESNFVSSVMNDEIIRKLDSQATNSINFLNEVLELKDMKPKVLTFDTFQMLTENSTEIKQDWDNTYTITEDELKCQIHYDLAVFHILREEYQKAKYHISQAKDLYNKLDTSESMLYCKIKKERLDGYCLACEVSVEGKQPNLTQQLLTSIKDQYTNILQILQADNIAREIPQVYRDNLELDIQGGLVNRKIIVARDLLLQIQCLNLVRKVVENETIIGDYVTEIKSAGSKGLEVLFWAFSGILEKSSALDKQRIARHLLYLVIMGDIDGLASRILNDPVYSNLFEASELQEIKKQSLSENLDIPNLLLNDDWGISPVEYTQKQKIEMFQLEQRLILSYDPDEIRKILMEIVHFHSGDSRYVKPLWQTNNSWEIPIPLQSVISALPASFLKDYSYILLAKSKELALSKDFSGAKSLLSIVENEIQRDAPILKEVTKGGHNSIPKLLKLLSWESLLVEICNCLYAWPVTDIRITQELTDECKQCLAALQSTDQVIPRQEIIEYCTVFLLNMAEWDYLTNLEKQWSCFEFAAALSNVAKHKGQKFPKDAWEMVLAAIRPNSHMQQKRSSGNSGSSGNSVSRDTLANISSTFSRLREVTVLNIAISLLARLHNILRDESSLELYTTYLNMWPASVPNAKQYNTRVIGEHLFQLLSMALKYYPNNVSWLRLMGDLNFVLGYYESAMKYYLEAIIVATDLFTLKIQGQLDDLVYRRMIKCCAHLQCNTQAVVLCQFLDEVDYALAFKMAGNEQKNAAPNDAMDAYYHCIWDTTILEYLINLHTKRGEHHRKQLAIKVIGLLELNSNNNEEIQREAANTRKARFLRALAKQYVY
ncbi:integrator complex subunit 8 isoform X1 [Nasonia vitripennis]|uniref:INTS8 TPR repeats domain-containing protein n=1 Tax=Nasonia vitripennis TaxID=7425 RepID=A0A7M7QC08_NASVI|nr:integrator complex subunit 8 isoform X1 [Nasonia vitripennis]